LCILIKLNIVFLLFNLMKLNAEICWPFWFGSVSFSSFFLHVLGRWKQFILLDACFTCHCSASHLLSLSLYVGKATYIERQNKTKMKRCINTRLFFVQCKTCHLQPHQRLLQQGVGLDCCTYNHLCFRFYLPFAPALLCRAHVDLLHLFFPSLRTTFNYVFCCCCFSCRTWWWALLSFFLFF